MLAVLLIPVLWSYAHSLTAPGADPWTARSVEWIGDDDGGGIVNGVEHWWYSNHPPPVGGKPNHGTPRSKAPAQDAVSKKTKAPPTPVASTSPLPAHLNPPGNLQPLATALPDEGVWHPTSRTVQGLPGVYTTFMRPDPIHTSLVTGIAWMDTKLLCGVRARAARAGRRAEPVGLADPARSPRRGWWPRSTPGSRWTEPAAGTARTARWCVRCVTAPRRS